MNCIKTIITSLVCINILSLSAQTETNKPDTTAADLNTVVVTGQAMPVSQRLAMSPVKILDAKYISESGSFNLRQALVHELGFDMEQKSVMGASVNIQGLTRENVKILIDGVPVIGRLNGILDLHQIQLDEIERIEIVEGPTSVFYGTDALAGAINIITKKKINGTYSAGLTGYYESVGQQNASLRTGVSHKNHTLIVSGGRNEFGGYSPIDTCRNKLWESREQYYGRLNYLYKINNKLSAHNQFRISDERMTILGNPNTANQAKDGIYKTFSWSNDIALNGEIKGGHYIAANASYTKYTRLNNYYQINLDDNTSELSVKSSDHDTTDMSLLFMRGQFTSAFRGKLNFTAGVEFSRESTSGLRILNRTQHVMETGLYAMATWNPFSKLMVRPAFRYNYNTAYHAPVTPAIYVKYFINDNAQINVSYARGFRSPSIKELFLDYYMPGRGVIYHIYGNTDLKAEQSDNFMLNYSHQFHFAKSRYIKIEPGFFYNDVRNLITLSDMVDNERYYININKHKTWGARAEVSASFIKNLQLSAGYQLMGLYNNYNETHDLNMFNYVNNATAAIKYQLPKYGFSVLAHARIHGDRPGFVLENNEINSTLIEGFTIFDFSITQSIWKKRIQLTAGAKNIFNITEIEMIGKESGEVHETSQAMWGRTFFIQLKFDISGWGK
jgi:outer membrane receptor for ferrienterochelin and colicins